MDYVRSQIKPDLCFNQHSSCCHAGYYGCVREILTNSPVYLLNLNDNASLLSFDVSPWPPQAQVYLASVYTQDPVMDGKKSVHYLKMAAERGVSALPDTSRSLSKPLPSQCTHPRNSYKAGYPQLFHLFVSNYVDLCESAQDGTALLFLGQCYESGFGVKQNIRTAIEFYERAAQAGNTQAKRLLMPPNATEGKGKNTCSAGEIHICVSHCLFVSFLNTTHDKGCNVCVNEQLIFLCVSLSISLLCIFPSIS